jgi:hypothetical protein
VTLYSRTSTPDAAYSGGVSEVVARFSPLSGYYVVNIDATVSTLSGQVFCHAVAHSVASGHNTSPTNLGHEEYKSEKATLGMTGVIAVAPGSIIELYCEASEASGTGSLVNFLSVESVAITATQVRTAQGDGPDHAARVAAKPLNSFVKALALSRAEKSRAGGRSTAPQLTDRSREARS